MADITFGHGTEPTPPATMDDPSQWHYVAICLMAHMEAYSLDEIDGLHWQWQQRAALRIRTAMQRHNISDIPGSPGYQEHASGHRRQRSQEVTQPPRQAARCNSHGRHQGPPPGSGSPSGTYRSPLRPFALRRNQGSPHTPAMQGGTPERHQETRNPGRSRRRSRTPPPRSTASRLPRGYGQRPWRSQRPQRPRRIICHRSQLPVQEAPHQTGAHPKHSHAN